MSKELLKKIGKAHPKREEPNEWGRAEATPRQIADAIKKAKGEGTFEELEPLYAPTLKDIEDKMQ